MTYKLEPIVEKIKSPVVLFLPDGLSQQYKDGVEVDRATFDKHYVIESIQASENVVNITLTIAESTVTESLF